MSLMFGMHFSMYKDLIIGVLVETWLMFTFFPFVQANTHYFAIIEQVYLRLSLC